jgi:hypothetical protein
MIILSAGLPDDVVEDERFDVTLESGNFPVRISMTSHQARCLLERLRFENLKFGHFVRGSSKTAEPLQFHAT